MRLLETIHSLDVMTFNWCLARRHRDLAIMIARAVSYTANGPLYALAGAVFIATENWWLVLLLIVSFVAERSCYFIFKSFFRRNRPPAAIPGYCSVIEPSDQFSFPSGHTSAAFLVACACTHAFPLGGWFLYPWATAVGISRILLGVHFPTDVLAGALMGLSLCHIMINILLI